MDYSGMAQKLGQFRQAQVPGGGQRPMNGWHDRMQPGGLQGRLQGVGNKLQGAFGGIRRGMQMFQQGMQFNNPIQGWNRPPAQAPMGQMPMMRPRNGNMGGGGSFGG
jgi:hypothetical protein